MEFTATVAVGGCHLETPSCRVRLTGVRSQESGVNHFECRVCGDPIPLLCSRKQEHKEFPVCAAADCRAVAKQRSAMDPAVFRHHLRFRQRVISEKRGRQAARQRLVEELRAQETRENQEILRQCLSQHPKLSEDDLDLLEIPSGHSATSVLPNDRIRRYAQHLQKTISEAAENSEAAHVPTDEKARNQLLDSETQFSENPQLRIISDQLCGMCKGGCCTDGGDTAYIGVHTVRQFMDAHPELSEEQVLDAYLSRLGSETVSNACINQTSAGCVLPREMRSATCNGYYCDSLRLWHERPHEERSGMVLAVQRSNSNWRRFDLDCHNSIVDVAVVRVGNIVPLTLNEESPVPVVDRQ